MAEINTKMIEEALSPQRGDVETIKNKRETELKISDAKS